MGDDAINVHDGLGYVSAVNGNTLTLIASAMRLREGDILAFKNGRFENTDAVAKIASVRDIDWITKEVVVEKLPESVTEGSSLATGLAITSAVAATSGTLFFILAKRKKDEDDDEEEEQL